MRLVCPNCDAKYEVPEDAIPDGGRDVQCANCEHAWFQTKQAPKVAAVEATARQDFAGVPEDDPDLPKTAARALAPQPTMASTYGVDDSVLAILREEAERESQARLSDARALEMQLETETDGALTAEQKRAAMLPGDPAEAAAKPGARRDLLPDVEEINSTLKPSEPIYDPDAEVDALPDLTRRRSSFRSGFMLMLVLAGLGLIAYLAAPQVSAQFPDLAGPLTAYVAFVDALRVQVDGLMQSATVAINGDPGG